MKSHCSLYRFARSTRDALGVLILERSSCGIFRFLRITSPAPRNSSSLDTLDIGLTITIVIRIILRMSVDNIVCIFYTNAIEDTDEIGCFHSQGREGYPRFNEIIM